MAYARTTIAELRSLLTERLGGNQTFWNLGEPDLALNEALAVWQLITGDFVLFATQTVPAGQDVIQLDTSNTPSLGFVRFRQLTTADPPVAATVLYPISIQEMDQGYYGRQGSASGTPEYVAPFGIDRFVLHPSAAVTQTLDVQYYSADPRLSLSGSDYLDLGDEEVLRILDYAQWVLSFKEGLKEALINTQPLKELFLVAAKLRNAKLRATALYKNYMGNDRDEQKPVRSANEQQGLRG